MDWNQMKGTPRKTLIITFCTGLKTFRTHTSSFLYNIIPNTFSVGIPRISTCLREGIMQYNESCQDEGYEDEMELWNESCQDDW